jgi:HEPN domain
MTKSRGTDPQPSLLSLFERHKALSIYWYNKASDLHGSAALIWAGMDDSEGSGIAEKLGLGRGFSFRAACWPVYEMLCGLALELLLKAVIVQKGREPKATHRLVELWKDAGLHPDETQKGLLEILTQSIYWFGRYPIPKNEADFDRLAKLHDRFLMDEVMLGGTGGIKVLRRNENLTWESFNRLWSAADSGYRFDP